MNVLLDGMFIPNTKYLEETQKILEKYYFYKYLLAFNLFQTCKSYDRKKYFNFM